MCWRAEIRVICSSSSAPDLLRSFGASASIVSASDAPVASRSAAAAAAASSADRSSMLGSRGDFRGDLPLSAAASASAPSDSIVLSGGARAVPPTARAEPPHPKPPPRARAPGVGGGAAAAAALSDDCESREGGSAGASPKPPPRTPRAGARTGESKGEPWPNGEPAATVASRAGGVDSRGGCSSDLNRPSSSPCVRIECAPSGSQWNETRRRSWRETNSAL